MSLKVVIHCGYFVAGWKDGVVKHMVKGKTEKEKEKERKRDLAILDGRD